MQQLQYIVIGDPQSPSFTFEGDDIMSTTGDFSVDMIGAELCTDVMEAEVSYDDTDGTLRALPWATPVYCYRGEHLVGKLYSVSVTRTGRTAYRIRTASAAGILEHDTFYGNMYTGETFKTVVEQIIGTNALQPFDGVYRHVILGTQGSIITSAYTSYGMGRYKDQAKTQEYYNGCFLLASMASKLSAKIKINGFSNELYNYYLESYYPPLTPDTSYRSSLLGVCAEAGASVDLKKHQYGLYMQMTRASTSVPFSTFGEVFFVYGQTTISLGTPSSADAAVYEIDVDPGAGTAVINGVTYPITLDNSVADDACALHVYAGGAKLFDDSGSIVASGIYPNCGLEMFHYTIQSPNGEMQADYVAVFNIFTRRGGYYDCVSRKLYKSIYSNVHVYIDTDVWQPYDISTYGGSLLFNNRTDFQIDVLASITYSNGIDSLPVYGWMPICTKRQALQQLLFATGVILIKDENGGILFTAPLAQSVENIDDDAVYDEGSEDQPEHINTVELTEHSFILDSSAQTETIYENNTGAVEGYYIAPFPEAPADPDMDGYHYSGYVDCIYANCNAALVSGVGKFAGRPYQHVTKMLHREIANYPDGHGASVPDATLVTLLNSESVMDRLEAYYGPAHKTRVDIAQNGERCGLMYTLTSAFGEPFSGFLVRASKVFTSIVRAACEFILGYTPPQIGGYTNYVILTGTGTWTVPASVFEKETPRIHVVLIGGGQGGDGGFAGEDGVQPEKGEGATPAEGGAPGNSGSGGKIFEVTITNPAASYAYSCGQGGAGGAISNSHSSNNLGSDGGDTSCSGGGQSYSSASGASSDVGIANVITGELYASRLISSWNPDPNNYSKGVGGDGGYRSAEYYGSEYHRAVGCYMYIMNHYRHGWWEGLEGAEYRSDGWLHASGGGGGGAGYGQDGSDGSAATYSGGVYRSGNGGKGGDATETPPKATDYNPTYYGYGGLGGGGGGGGGAGGWVLNDTAVYSVGTGGAGGYGGRGGDGGDGCVLIYY